MSFVSRVTLPASRESRISLAVPLRDALSDTDLACRIDRLADHELHLGRHAAAERLSQQAAELRGRAP